MLEQQEAVIGRLIRNMDSVEKAIETNPFDHILYEFSMYLQASVLISTEQFINNLLVDSRMVHMRNLAYFFCSDNDKGKGYLHYTAYIKDRLADEIDHELFSNIQRITSNSTCHLLKGRFSENFKQETAQFEQMVFPKLSMLIKEFVSFASSERIREECRNQWENEQIQLNAVYVMDLISYIEKGSLFPTTRITTE